MNLLWLVYLLVVPLKISGKEWQYKSYPLLNPLFSYPTSVQLQVALDILRGKFDIYFWHIGISTFCRWKKYWDVHVNYMKYYRLHLRVSSLFTVSVTMAAFLHQSGREHNIYREYCNLVKGQLTALCFIIIFFPRHLTILITFAYLSSFNIS